ncbi:MAG: 30S ribosomal protein S8 [Candidatus Woykebacteria bacterium GWB1_45_5]|uniref:Small ribosomal subunit protein uS8 n=2 Tax=Candidatus Woykeibacteriota TaxID=1817899 RepID=A0A1G1W2T9_9BACT|nr:MAG: 30S ribosomal protein S8 [Candidatus Woykebacteria bacterium GWA1_44_8]OGY23319.1 MAG: 30S ribosomal protein S8 [Candidatus Woykebacteria bacterium GWB1_45_5]
MDPVADALTIIRNGYLARKQTVSIPYSRLKEAIVKKIIDLGFLDSVAVSENERKLEVSLRYEAGESALHSIKTVSKPSLRVYKASKKIPKVLSGRGEVILSTSKGILAGAEARKAKLGGEILLKVW